ncbi:MAG: heavy-metal-associated domain-containing protein [Firmicutes bacterium]|nr:heavy-metal-associated domain-containing protein [Bacillota bacterium]
MAEKQSLTLKIEGMSCNHCKMAVEKALKSLAGVDTVQVDLAGGAAQVLYDPAKVGKQQMAAAVSDAGYQVVD